MVHCYIKYDDPYVEFIENDGTIRKAIAYKMSQRELEYLKQDIEKVLEKIKERLEEDIPQF